MRISKFEQQAKNPDRVSVFVDDKFSFGLSKRALVQLGIKVGDEISNQQLNEYKENARDSKLTDLAINWAMRRHHSSREIHDYLKARTDDENLHKLTFNSLEKYGFVDDERFAQAWYEARRRRGYSTFQIKGELMKKGIDSSIIDLTINEEDETIALKQLAVKKHKLTAYKDRTKLKAYLIRKGYRYSEVTKVLEEL